MLLLKGGRVVDPSQGLDLIGDLLIRDGKISEIGGINEVLVGVRPDEVWDVSGKMVLPGLIDMHVHFREPGFEYKEDIASGAKAAAAGGFTTVATMPNTEPFTDCADVVRFILGRAETVGLVRVRPIGALTKGMKGEEIADIGEMIQAGAVAFSDDAFPIADPVIMRRAMECCAKLDVPVILHCEDKSLSGEGLMNEGPTAARLGLKGIPREAEDYAVSRNLGLAKLAGCRVHIAHVSTRGSAEIIRRAKKSGIRVTCETCPQYFTLTEESVLGYNANAKVNPPLRTSDDVAAIKEGLADGTIDVIATDHAPHSVEEKAADFAAAPSGMIGMETAVGLVMTELVKPGVLSLVDALKKMSLSPASVLGLDSGTLRVGKQADISVIDTSAEWTVDPLKFLSKGRNTVLGGRRLVGKPVMTVLGGRIVAKNGPV